MRILAFLTEPFTITGILRHLELPATAPPLTPARSPPRGEMALELDADSLLDLDQTPAFDPPSRIPSRSSISIRPGAPEGGAAPGARPEPSPHRCLPPATAPSAEPPGSQ